MLARRGLERCTRGRPQAGGGDTAGATQVRWLLAPSPPPPPPPPERASALRCGKRAASGHALACRAAHLLPSGLDAKRATDVMSAGRDAVCAASPLRDPAPRAVLQPGRCAHAAARPASVTSAGSWVLDGRRGVVQTATSWLPNRGPPSGTLQGRHPVGRIRFGGSAAVAGRASTGRRRWGAEGTPARYPATSPHPKPTTAVPAAAASTRRMGGARGVEARRGGLAVRGGAKSPISRHRAASATACTPSRCHGVGKAGVGASGSLRACLCLLARADEGGPAARRPRAPPPPQYTYLAG
jgi:hypothetical protein